MLPDIAKSICVRGKDTAYDEQKQPWILFFSNSMMRQYESHIRDVIELTMARIDVQDMKECMETSKESETYRELIEFMDQARQYYELESLADTLVAMSENMKTYVEELLTSAVGLAVYDSSIDMSSDDVLKRSDKAMYENKKRMKAERGD